MFPAQQLLTPQATLYFGSRFANKSELWHNAYIIQQ